MTETKYHTFWVELIPQFSPALKRSLAREIFMEKELPFDKKRFSEISYFPENLVNCLTTKKLVKETSIPFIPHSHQLPTGPPDYMLAIFLDRYTVCFFLLFLSHIILFLASFPPSLILHTSSPFCFSAFPRA